MREERLEAKTLVVGREDGKLYRFFTTFLA
jgi:hypothetical protein